MLTPSKTSNLTIAGANQRGPSVGQRLAGRASESDGVTMLELLVVTLIIGILVAIAIPSLLSTTTRATDAQAKELARAGQTAAAAIETEDGNYLSVTPAALTAEEPTISSTASNQHAYVSSTTPGENEYSVTATATNGDELTIAVDASGTATRTCYSPALKTGCDGGESSSW